MALSWTWLVPVFGMLVFYYLQKNVSTTQKDAIVLNRTYDYIIGTLQLRNEIIIHVYGYLLPMKLLAR